MTLVILTYIIQKKHNWRYLDEMQNENVFFTTDKYSNLTDEQIISQIKQGDQESLAYEAINHTYTCSKDWNYSQLLTV